MLNASVFDLVRGIQTRSITPEMMQIYKAHHTAEMGNKAQMERFQMQITAGQISSLTQIMNSQVPIALGTGFVHVPVVPPDVHAMFNEDLDTKVKSLSDPERFKVKMPDELFVYSALELRRNLDALRPPTPEEAKDKAFHRALRIAQGAAISAQKGAEEDAFATALQRELTALGFPENVRQAANRVLAFVQCGHIADAAKLGHALTGVWYYRESGCFSPDAGMTIAIYRRNHVGIELVFAAKQEAFEPPQVKPFHWLIGLDRGQQFLLERFDWSERTRHAKHTSQPLAKAFKPTKMVMQGLSV